jgi:hypothetical protein
LSEPNNTSKKKQLNNYAKYASMGFQMGVIMFIGTFGGYKLDKYCAFKIPVFTVVFALLSIAIALYLTLKDFCRMNTLLHY